MLIQAGRKSGELRAGPNSEMKANSTKNLPYVVSSFLLLSLLTIALSVLYREELRPEPVRSLFSWIYRVPN